MNLWTRILAGLSLSRKAARGTSAAAEAGFPWKGG